MRDDIARVVDIRLACQDIAEFVSDVSEKDYLQDRKLRFTTDRGAREAGRARLRTSERFFRVATR